MTLETAKTRIEIIVEALLAIEDYENFAKTQEKQWSNLLQQLLENYYYITKNTNFNDEFRKEATESIINLKIQKPKLTNIIDHILNATLLEFSPNNKMKKVEPAKLINEIKKYINKIENNNFFDTETITSIQWDLCELKKQLIYQKTDFEENIFRELINLLDNHLIKINNTISIWETNNIKFKF